MTKVVGDGRSCFTFIWKIKNFTYCVQRNEECLSSPEFPVDILQKTAWELQLYPRGSDEGKEDHVGLYLHRTKSTNPADYFNVTVDCELSILSEERSPKNIRKFTNHSMPALQSESFGFPCFILRSTIYKEKKSEFLPEGTLTIQCRMWMVPHIIVPGLCLAQTTIGVEQKSFIWTIPKLSLSYGRCKTIHTDTAMATRFELITSGPTDKNYKDHVDIRIVQLKTSKPNFVTCVISYFKSTGGKVVSEEAHHWFGASENRQVWSFPSFFTRSKLVSDECLFVANDRLILSCEYKISFGIPVSYIESLQLELPGYRNLTPQVKPEPAAWQSSFQKGLKVLYDDGTLCDVSLRVGKDVFPVHKTILCGQSAVFKAMLTCEMKETNDDIVDIEDLDSDTVEEMLSFMYTGTHRKILTLEGELQLYFAADKYEVHALKQRCSASIKASLCESNACNILGFADTLSDVELKEHARDFIYTHIYEMMRSDQWKEFVEQKCALAAETLDLMLKKKLEIVN